MYHLDIVCGETGQNGNETKYKCKCYCKHT